MKNSFEITVVQQETDAVRRESEKTIELLKSQIVTLSRKPYAEELGRQATALIAKLSPQGKILLRHLLTSGPLELLRQFKPEIDQGVQSTQMSLACDSGIVRRDIVRTGLGNVVEQNYVINPEFRLVLMDLLY